MGKGVNSFEKKVNLVQDNLIAVQYKVKLFQDNIVLVQDKVTSIETSFKNQRKY